MNTAEDITVNVTNVSLTRATQDPPDLAAIHSEWPILRIVIIGHGAQLEITTDQSLSPTNWMSLAFQGSSVVLAASPIRATAVRHGGAVTFETRKVTSLFSSARMIAEVPYDICVRAVEKAANLATSWKLDKHHLIQQILTRYTAMLRVDGDIWLTKRIRRLVEVMLDRKEAVSVLCTIDRKRGVSCMTYVSDLFTAVLKIDPVGYHLVAAATAWMHDVITDATAVGLSLM